MRSIALGFAAVAVAVAAAPRPQETPDFQPQTVRFLPLVNCVYDLLTAATDKAAPDDPAHLLWLVDLSADAKRNGQMIQIARAMEEAAARLRPPRDRAARIAIATMGPTVKQALDFTDRWEKVSACFKELQTTSKPEGSVNLGECIQQAAKILGKRRHAMLVVCAQTGLEGEKDLEETGRELAHHSIGVASLTGETPYSNPFGRTAAPQDSKAQWAGPESPYPEFPPQWIFSDVDPLYTVPSGFAPYGLRRLAALTRTVNVICVPAANFPTYCETVDCRLCAHRHLGCALALDEAKMRLLEPFTGSRTDFRRHAARDPMWKAVYETWSSLAKAGVVNSQAPLRGDALSEQATGPYQGAPALTFLSEWVSERATAKAMREQLQPTIQSLEKAIADGRDRGEKRAIVTAEAILIYAKIARFNLAQLELFLDEMSGLVRRRRGSLEFGDDVFDYYARSKTNYTGYTYECVYLCHLMADTSATSTGAAGTFLGKPQELADLLKEARAFVERHQGTPWQILVQHANLAVFIPTRKNLADALFDDRCLKLLSRWTFAYYTKATPTYNFNVGGSSAGTFKDPRPSDVRDTPTPGGSAFGSNRPAGAPAPSGSGGGIATGK